MYQALGTCVSVVGFVLYVYYFVNISTHDNSYISDNLHRDFTFRFAVSFILAVQNILFIMYFLRFRLVSLALATTGIIFVLISQGGWCLLTIIYTMPWHMVGFSIFVSGVLVYWMVILILDKEQYIVDNKEYIIVLTSFGFCFLYSIFYVLYNDISWLYEHIGMIFFNMALIYFFLHHDPNPREIMVLVSTQRIVVTAS
jgi:hypothetical protein